MFCKNCGTENRNDSKFCLNCGEKLPDYTKPRENLLMPEDVKNAQVTAQKKEKLNRTILWLNIVSIISLIIAVTFTILSFFKIKFVAIIIGLIFCAIYIILTIVNIAMVKASLKKKANNLDKDSKKNKK